MGREAQRELEGFPNAEGTSAIENEVSTGRTYRGVREKAHLPGIKT
jgi:hypothetical protein